jgi:hypothetical protein
LEREKTTDTAVFWKYANAIGLGVIGYGMDGKWKQTAMKGLRR